MWFLRKLVSFCAQSFLLDLPQVLLQKNLKSLLKLILDFASKMSKKAHKFAPKKSILSTKMSGGESLIRSSLEKSYQITICWVAEPFIQGWLSTNWLRKGEKWFWVPKSAFTKDTQVIGVSVLGIKGFLLEEIPWEGSLSWNSLEVYFSSRNYSESPKQPALRNKMENSSNPTPFHHSFVFFSIKCGCFHLIVSYSFDCGIWFLFNCLFIVLDELLTRLHFFNATWTIKLYWKSFSEE